MIEPVYRVKLPLTWMEISPGLWVAESPFRNGCYRVTVKRWWDDGGCVRIVESIEAGIAACEADYRERVLRCLIPVVPEPDEFDYNSVPLKPAGSVMVRYVDGGEMKPGIVGEDDNAET